MYRQKILAIFVLFIVSIAAYPAKNEKICSQNFMINGTNLVTNYRKQVLVIGVTHLGCQACRNQAIKYNDLYRDLEYHNIREPDVRLILVNEQHGAQYLPGIYYGKIRLFQDNYKDQFIEKLGLHGHRLNNLIFGRCGDLVYTQRYPQSNIEEETNYQQLLRIIMTVAKNKQACHKMCG
ncbi:unnamed protein product [Rotaria sordida]|uniref:Uncharacterized protein n=1 Tax=Rotaria sordida TaxID=392033 RepID=A0A819L955_9BILA|nr:unnamed protein product [Rotaria sordida]CAF1019507.1 unnamed protein product [Rotaria sordida]CAF3645899.1 unnamed protein product [Rotaria sordida]CAF3915910.1 unnamed protein product [Rotaria sordida]CAF3957002.1 unnamed protein product [Rotaria sordida]